MTVKDFKSKYYNYYFNKETGLFGRWGRTASEDPHIAPAPEILDIEVSTVCHGIGTPCRWCYKSNTGNGVNMSLETFKKILDKMPKALTQAAFGIGDIGANLDLLNMFQYCRDKDVVPNVTINGWRFNTEWAEALTKLCGAVAVSRYGDKDVCYEAVMNLTNAGMKQVNIHQLVSIETLPNIVETIQDIKTDARLEKLNAIVFLTLKPKGDRNNLTLVNDGHYREIVDMCLKEDIRFGFDSCSANRFLRTVKGHEQYERFKQLSEPCESSLFSSYINVDGKFFPCSFSENTKGWEEGLDVVNCKDFVEDIWNHPKTLRFRSDLLMRCRDCPIYDI